MREITAGALDFIEDDRFERAIRDLTGLGLLHCPGGVVVPSHAALRNYSPLKRYEGERAKKHSKDTLDQARDRYGVGVGVGLLVLEERYRKLEKEGKKRPTDTLAERHAVARAALALMPDFDRLVQEAGLETEELA